MRSPVRAATRRPRPPASTTVGRVIARSLVPESLHDDARTQVVDPEIDLGEAKLQHRGPQVSFPVGKEQEKAAPTCSDQFSAERAGVNAPTNPAVDSLVNRRGRAGIFQIPLLAQQLGKVR